MKKLSQIIKILLINLLIILFLLILIDPLFRIEEPVITQRSVILKEHPPNCDTYITMTEEYFANATENFQYLPTTRLRTDENGFIIGENSILQNPGPVDMIFFGGSTTECIHVDENLRFPYLVGEKLVSINTGMNIKSLNGGVTANHSLHSTLNLLAKGVNRDPGIVIFMHNVNDLSQLTKTGNYWDGPISRSIIQHGKNENKLTSFLKNSMDLTIPNISRLVWRSLQNLITTPVDFDEWKGFRNHSIQNFEYENIEKKFEEAIKSFIAIARAFNIEVVLMTQFSRINPDDLFVRKVLDYSEYYYFNDEDFYVFCDYYDRFNDKIREVAEKENLILIDLAKLVPASNLYIYDPVHLNNRGSELVANIIASELEKNYPYFLIIK